MSKCYSLVLVIIATVLFAAATSRSQDLEATIAIDPAAGTARITGRFSHEPVGRSTASLPFLLDYAGATGLGERFSAITVTDSKGNTVPNRPIIPGEFLADRPFIEWKYVADLKPLADTTSRAHISWLLKDQGILMLHDLLPLKGRGKAAKINLALPAGWTVLTVCRRTGVNSFEVEDLENAVFFLSREGAAREIASARLPLSVNIAGSWQYTDTEAARMAEAVFEYYEQLFGSRPAGRVLVGLYRSPSHVRAGNWEADTRGTTVTIVSSDMPFKSQSLQRLHEQLRHEIFHLWIPNGLSLSGNYDWFYEGFALYQSLKMAVAVNRIRFEDVLDALSQAHLIDNKNTNPVSLIDASKQRWNSANTDVYARGMLVAFLCDVAILDRSKGKRSISELIMDVYRRHHTKNDPVDGNIAILSIIDSYGLEQIGRRYIAGKEKIDWGPTLKVAGLEQKGNNSSAKLTVVSKPAGRQKDLLDKLGYNNWRKLSRKQ